MLALDLALHRLDPRQWHAGWRLLVPPRLLLRPRWALAIVEGTPPALLRLIIAGHDATGTVANAPHLPGLDHSSLAAWAASLGVGALIVLDRRVIAELSADIERQLSLEQDLVEQGLIAWRAVKRRVGRGIWTEPPLLEMLPTPTFEALQRTFDLLVPDDSALSIHVIDDDLRSVHASIIAVKRNGHLAEVTSHAAIADDVDEAEFAATWKKSHGKVTAAIAHRIAKPSLAIFLEKATLLRIVTGPSDQLSRELNAGTVVIEPAPTWLLGLLGGAAVAAVATRGARALASLLPAAARQRASDFAQRAQTAMRDSGTHPFALLGFDPLALWASVREFYKAP